MKVKGQNLKQKHQIWLSIIIFYQRQVWWKIMKNGQASHLAQHKSASTLRCVTAIWSAHPSATTTVQRHCRRTSRDVKHWRLTSSLRFGQQKELGEESHWMSLAIVKQVMFTLQLSKFLRRQNILWLHWCLTWETKVAFTRWRFLPDMPLDLYSSGWPIYGKSRFQSFQNRVKCFVFHRLRCDVKTSIAKKKCVLGVVQNNILSSSCKYTSHHTSYKCQLSMPHLKDLTNGVPG